MARCWIPLRLNLLLRGFFRNVTCSLVEVCRRYGGRSFATSAEYQIIRRHILQHINSKPYLLSYVTFTCSSPYCLSSSSESAQDEHAPWASPPSSPCNLQRWAMGNTCLRQAWRGWALYWRVEYSTARPRSSGTREIRKLPAAMSQQGGVTYLNSGWWHYRAKETWSLCVNTKSWICMEVWRSGSQRTVDPVFRRRGIWRVSIHVTKIWCRAVW
jgi:hypothetical protein